jgi:hypothetical protein
MGGYGSGRGHSVDRHRQVESCLILDADTIPRPIVAGNEGDIDLTLGLTRGLAELVQLLVEGVQAKGRTVEPESIEWTPPARPFFEPAALLWRPRTDSNRRRRP